MSERQPGPYGTTLRKWLALADRRHAHLVELRESGRWRYYYEWEELLAALGEARQSQEIWANLAGIDQSPASGEIGDLPEPDAEPLRKAG